MSPDHPTLAEQTAGLRLALAQQVEESWLPQAIQTLILAIVSRLFGRLEDMMRLWEAGLLPQPATRPSRATPDNASSDAPGLAPTRAPSRPIRHPRPDSRAHVAPTQAQAAHGGAVHGTSALPRARLVTRAAARPTRARATPIAPEPLPISAAQPHVAALQRAPPKKRQVQPAATHALIVSISKYIGIFH